MEDYKIPIDIEKWVSIFTPRDNPDARLCSVGFMAWLNQEVIPTLAKTARRSVLERAVELLELADEQEDVEINLDTVRLVLGALMEE